MVNSYFVHFHRSFPILHRPTFSLSAVPVSLLRVVVAIGSLYTASNLPLPERQPILKEADENWERSRKELKSLVRSALLALAQRTLQLGVEVDNPETLIQFQKFTFVAACWLQPPLVELEF